MAVLDVRAAHCVPCHTSAPGWDTLISETGLSRSTVAARIADAIALGLVARLQGGELGTNDDDVPNLRAVYVLVAPSNTAVNETRTPSGNSLRSFPGKTEQHRFAALNSLQKEQPIPEQMWPLVAQALCHHVLWLRQAHRGNVRVIIEPYLRQGSHLPDLLHGCQTDPTGNPFGALPADTATNACGLLRSRLRRSLSSVPTPVTGRQLDERTAADRRLPRQLPACSEPRPGTAAQADV
ncbi:MAG: hypothetical protein KDA37_16230, partial [Planctomycetales bacterium]|nr:hypothetical protein [Planctomycetales bacterium]